MHEMLQGKYFIFNVGPKEHIRYMGSFGRFTIPACPEDQEYAGPVVYRGKPGIPSMMPETVVKSVEGRTVEYDWNFTTEGRKFVNDLLGVGAFHDVSDDLTKHGVFLAAGPVPTQAEIAAAKQKIQTLFDERVRLADQRYEVNGGMETNNGKSVYTITEDDVYACKALGLDRPWARKNHQMVPCEGCGSPVAPNAVRCPNPGCGAILNEEKARKLFPHLYAHEVQEQPAKRAYNRKVEAA
jgi:hypothetical protein